MGMSKYNLLAIIGLSTYTFSRWTMIAHHTCHGGYDKCHPQKDRWNRFKFAVGSLTTRIMDWFDWMLPEAWNVEHNNRHHYCLSELDDPDLVENNLKSIRELKVSVYVKYAIVFVNMLTWKWAYYAPNTYKELKLSKLRREGKPLPKGLDPTDAVTMTTILFGTKEENGFYSFSEFFRVVVGPYLNFISLFFRYLWLLLRASWVDHSENSISMLWETCSSPNY